MSEPYLRAELEILYLTPEDAVMTSGGKDETPVDSDGDEFKY